MDKNLELIKKVINEANNRLIELSGVSELNLKLLGLISIIDDTINDKVLIITNQYEQNFGKVGHCANFKNYNIGDLVYTESRKEKIVSMVVENNGSISVYGWGRTPLSELDLDVNLTLIKKYDELNRSDFEKLKYKLKFSEVDENKC